jgi:hypothetical protein
LVYLFYLFITIMIMAIAIAMMMATATKIKSNIIVFATSWLVVGCDEPVGDGSAITFIEVSAFELPYELEPANEVTIRKGPALSGVKTALNVPLASEVTVAICRRLFGWVVFKYLANYSIVNTYVS